MILIGSHLIPEHLSAQNHTQKKATLMGWENNIRLFIEDRSNNAGGLYYDRGLFRMHTLPMDMEYSLDLFTYQFNYFDDYDWYHSGSGFRSYVGSINTSDFVVQSHLKKQLPIYERGTLNIMAVQVEDFRALRGLISLDYNHLLGKKHRLGIQHIISQTKNDLDATFYYQYGDRESGVIRAEFTALDWANNIISHISTSRNSDYDFHRVYNQKPYLYTLRVESPQVGIFRGEATTAVQPVSKAEISRGEYPDENYILRDWVNYQAALLEANFSGATLGVIYQRTFAKMEREPSENSQYPLHYGNRQVQQRGGIYFTYRWRGLGVEQWFWTEWNRDQQFDENPDAFTQQEPQYNEGGRNPDQYPFHLDEVRRFNKTRLFYEPENKLLSIYIEHNGDWRSPALDGNSDVPARNYRNFYPNHILERNERLTVGFGFTFNSHAKLTLGASFDLDGDLQHGYGWERDDSSYALFDGGFGRLQILW